MREQVGVMQQGTKTGACPACCSRATRAPARAARGEMGAWVVAGAEPEPCARPRLLQAWAAGGWGGGWEGGGGGDGDRHQKAATAPHVRDHCTRGTTNHSVHPVCMRCALVVHASGQGGQRAVPQRRTHAACRSRQVRKRNGEPSKGAGWALGRHSSKKLGEAPGPSQQHGSVGLLELGRHSSKKLGREGS
jgi:hypothetical protein